MQLILDQICKSFGTKEVLKNASFTFEQGKIYGLLGRNGSGKTTLFNCLSAEFPADGGTVSLVDEYGQTRTPKQGDIGYVLSTPVVPEFLTGTEFVKFFQEISQDKSGRTPDQWLELVGLEPDDRNRLMRGYSHGMKHKIQMLCFLIGRPPVILLDEPLTSFDVVAALEMKNLLREMKGDHIILFSTHILQLAQDLCDEIVLLHQGELEGVDNAKIHTPEFESYIVDLLTQEEDGEEVAP
ncbi:ABC transporter ATP-binding protein [Pseudoflavonifractor capillosus]|uniref:ABC transporter ATP-binding protein n=1 Tax=Pseudoflavonifractor TaxID=1017280 RepID=UPI000B3A28BA|nr:MULTISPECIES: ABC transporter ATP-binding protein [Pseudoflavonifractor]MBM6694861.1 ABC transporter ATP-binding protein [Pseudoflavonifractor capillosus]OUN98061.1 ABC transporter ATP-binding protein [Pseudoflavonifractor sp. An44]OUP63478.1 ABC transporter ATP-binding protein [Pseudoflavonifractor sp. An176]